MHQALMDQLKNVESAGMGTKLRLPSDRRLRAMQIGMVQLFFLVSYLYGFIDMHIKRVEF